MQTMDESHVQLCLSFLHAMAEKFPRHDFAVRLWDGTVWAPEPGLPARFTLVLNHAGALRAMFLTPNQLSLGKAYLHDDFDIEGDAEAAFSLAEALCDTRVGFLELLQRWTSLHRLPPLHHPHSDRDPAHLKGTVHSRKRDRKAIAYHYNISNDFYRLWLDRRMVYSCAYFTDPGDDLDQAQERKLDYICRKLRLQKDERFLDIGCGWGGLIIHAARRYQVQALGITLSRAQAELADERINEAGVADRCRVMQMDYRDLGKANLYDKLASVGMFEHVGEGHLAEYFGHTWNLLRPGGVFLNHGIGRSLTVPQLQGPSFIDRYVFPDGELVPINQALHHAESTGFEVRDLESLREHYLLTLRQWVRRLEAHHDEACRAADEETYRIWRLYMAGSAHGFKTGQINLYQALLVKPDNGKSGLPLTRDDWYH